MTQADRIGLSRLDLQFQPWVLVSQWSPITCEQFLTLSYFLLGLLNLLNENANVASQIVYPLIAGIGLGMLFHAPYQVFLRALKPQELATGTSAFFLTRFTGATVGLVSLLLDHPLYRVHSTYRQSQAQSFMLGSQVLYRLISSSRSPLHRSIMQR